MPREIVHWDVLHRAVERLSQRGYPDLSRVARDNQTLLALGAVAHDAPYYRHGGGSNFEWVGSLLHGLGGAPESLDPLHPLSLFGAKVATSKEPEARDAGLAFLLGLLSHYATDVSYHPAIFFFTGDYYAVDAKLRADARARHRLFEVYLDEDRRTRAGGIPWSTSLTSLLRAVSSRTLDFVCAELADAVKPAVTPHDITLVPGLANEWSVSLREMARFQHLFLSPWWGTVAHVLNRLSCSHLHQFEVLFARGRTGYHAPLHEPWSYRNPVSGESVTASMNELDERAIQLTLELFTVVQDALTNGGITPSTLAGGVSLNYGVQGSAPEDATFFSPQGFSLSGLTVPR